MARIRTVKPEFFRHEGLQDLEIANPGAYTMLVFAGLWGHCDKAGRFEWKPRMLKLDILPFLEFDMEKTLLLLREAGFIRRYEVAGKIYGEILSFVKHQRINGKEAQDPVKHPAPIEVAQGSTGEASGNQRGNCDEKDAVSHALPTTSAPSRPEGSESPLVVVNHSVCLGSEAGSNGEAMGKQQRSQEGKGREEYTTPLTPLSQGGMPEGALESDQEQASLDKKPGRKRAQAVSLQAFLQKCRDEGVKPIPVDDPIFDFADSVGIPHDWLRLAWMEFKTRFGDNKTRKSDWRAHFRNAVRSNWFRLWFAGENGMQLSSQGRILSEAHREAA